MPAPKKLTKLALGPSGVTVARNVKRLMESRGLTYVALAERLDSIGRPIPTLGLRKIVGLTRRVDADDLVALAVALGVTPVTLLYPPEPTDDVLVEVTGAGEMVSHLAWGWLVARMPLLGDDAMEFFARAWPEWVRRQAEVIRGDDQ